jgi:hemerythrin
MKWSEDFTTGFEHLDRQHRMLFAMADNFREALDHGEGERSYGAMLDGLGGYARAHFGIEQGCMEECACPAADINREAHRRFLDTLNSFQQRFEADGFIRADAYALIGFVERWLVEHIGQIDVQLRPCAQQRSRQ